ncbi:hypothetical protein NHX12_029139 [Muraenolepis orangiensis]|uniref:Beta-1,3-galactosyl-O-glycosyl-glycoprotein beta-1,6-N-acetylglucosaminyltransferase n=1 Tax=Muraenolepis orangiensis TaxID=630683 RepID=A0A9Q0EF20_9TELE|nr:hypothetical protein NHX12_029139 [Muraenolepis orangiensis]
MAKVSGDRILLGIILMSLALWAVIVYGPIQNLSGSYSIVYKLMYSSLELTDDGVPEEAFNCSAIQKGDAVEVDKAKRLSGTKDFREKVRVSEEYYVNATQDCRHYILTRKYLEYPLSKEEEDFPLAYSIVVHHKVQNFERLLRSIYAPQNVYCVHVDKKVQPSTLASFMGIASCFPNVFMVSQPVSVTYAGWSRVQADLNCMADLFNVSATWKYLINLCGQDFPLKTNLEMVRSLQALDGGNSVNSETPPSGQAWKWTIVHQEVDGSVHGTGQQRGPPPLNILLHYGSAYIIVSRGYIQSVLEDSRIQALIEWAKGIYSPDENLWATIQRMPGVPGSTPANSKYDMTDINAVSRLVKWHGLEGPRDTEAAYPPCEGHHVRSICVYGTGDLSWLLKQHHLFANKFDIDMDYIALHCLDHYLRHKALTDIS